MLPDGTVIRSWEQPRRYTHTYHVAQGEPQASDENPGTPDRPWRTIGKATATLQPGERVIVHRGVYREWVRLERGGTGPDRMIWYEATSGEDVQISGTDVWSPQWQATDGAWRAVLDPKLFLGENPFALENFPVQPSAEWKRFPSMELRRGQVFLDGKPLPPVAIEGGSGRLTAFVRARPGQAASAVVIHLVEWGQGAAAVLKVRSELVLGAAAARVEQRLPRPYDAQAHVAAEASKDYQRLISKESQASRQGPWMSIEVPALNPWGMVLIEKQVIKKQD